MGKFEVLVISYIFAMNIKISFNMFTFMETHSLMQLQFTVLTMLTFLSQSNFTLSHFCPKEVENSKSKIAPVCRHVHGLLELLGYYIIKQ